MGANNFETLFGENLIEDARVTSAAPKYQKPKLFSIRAKATQATATSEDGVRLIPVNQIVVNKQHRAAFEEIAELAESIKELGLIQPLLVRPRSDQKFDLVAGERRLRAAKELNLKNVPCDIREITDGEVAALQLAENLMRKNLNPIEEARGFDDVIKKNGFTLERVAKIYGRNKSTISRSLKLLELPEDIQQQVASGEVAPRAARELARLGSEDEQKETLEFATERKLTAEQTTKIVRRRTGAGSRTRSLEFPTEFGVIVIKLNKEATTYDHVKAAFGLAMGEIQHRIDNDTKLLK